MDLVCSFALKVRPKFSATHKSVVSSVLVCHGYHRFIHNSMHWNSRNLIKDRLIWSFFILLGIDPFGRVFHGFFFNHCQNLHLRHFVDLVEVDFDFIIQVPLD